MAFSRFKDGVAERAPRPDVSSRERERERERERRAHARDAPCLSDSQLELVRKICANARGRRRSDTGSRFSRSPSRPPRARRPDTFGAQVAAHPEEDKFRSLRASSKALSAKARVRRVCLFLTQASRFSRGDSLALPVSLRNLKQVLAKPGGRELLTEIGWRSSREALEATVALEPRAAEQDYLRAVASSPAPRYDLILFLNF